MVLYTLEQCVFLYNTYVKSESARKCQQKFWCKFHFERVHSRKTIHNLVNKFRTTKLLIDKKQKCKCQVLTEEKLDDIGARLQHTPRKSLKRLAQETGVSKSSARIETRFLKLRPSKTTVIHALQPRNPTTMVHFCNWFLQSVVKGESNPQLTFLAVEAWFHLQGYINMHNNHYWSLHNTHLTHEVPLHPEKVGV
jgi:transposase